MTSSTERGNTKLQKDDRSNIEKVKEILLSSNHAVFFVEREYPRTAEFLIFAEMVDCMIPKKSRTSIT